MGLLLYGGIEKKHKKWQKNKQKWYKKIKILNVWHVLFLIKLICYVLFFFFPPAPFSFQICCFFLSSWLYVFLMDGHVSVPLALSSSGGGIGGGGGWLGRGGGAWGYISGSGCECWHSPPPPSYPCWFHATGTGVEWGGGVGWRLDGRGRGRQGIWTGVWGRNADLVYCVCSLFCGCVQHKRCPPLFILTFSLHSFQVVHASLCLI